MTKLEKLEKSQQGLLEIMPEIIELIPELYKEDLHMTLDMGYSPSFNIVTSYVYISDNKVENSSKIIHLDGYTYKDAKVFLEAIKELRDSFINNRESNKKAKIREMKKAIKKMEATNDK